MGLVCAEVWSWKIETIKRTVNRVQGWKLDVTNETSHGSQKLDSENKKTLKIMKTNLSPSSTSSFRKLFSSSTPQSFSATPSAISRLAQTEGREKKKWRNYANEIISQGKHEDFCHIFPSISEIFCLPSSPSLAFNERRWKFVARRKFSIIVCSSTSPPSLNVLISVVISEQGSIGFVFELLVSLIECQRSSHQHPPPSSDFKVKGFRFVNVVAFRYSNEHNFPCDSFFSLSTF